MKKIARNRSNEVVGDSKVECDGSEEPCSDESSSAVQSIANVPTNREVVAEELPKRDTVKKARSLFEKAGDSVEVYATLRPSSSTRMSHVKTNPSSRILRSESIPSILAEEMLMHKYRWPAGQQQRAGPASPTASPAHYRSNPSLCRNFSSRHSTDVDSLVSELSCDWSSDVESEASYASFSGRDPFPQGRKDDSDARYVSPQVLQKIRSYGMTLTFVNGRMIDGGDDDDTADYHSDDVVDHVIDRRLKRSDSKTLRSAGNHYFPLSIHSLILYHLISINSFKFGFFAQMRILSQSVQSKMIKIIQNSWIIIKNHPRKDYFHQKSSKMIFKKIINWS